MDTRKPVVLLVDDDENVLHGLARTLRKQPYLLHTARSAEEAMSIMPTAAKRRRM